MESSERNRELVVLRITQQDRERERERDRDREKDREKEREIEQEVFTRWLRVREMTKGSIDETLSSLNLYIKHGILQLQDTWEEIGLEREDQAQKCDSIVSSLRSVLDSIVIGENAYKECLDEECLELSQRCNESFKLLGMPTFNPGSLTVPLLTRKNFLIKKSEELKEEVAVKTAQIEKLEERKTQCIQRLGLQPDHYPTIQSDNITRIISLLEIQVR
eukprot:sb/3469887/